MKKLRLTALGLALLLLLSGCTAMLERGYTSVTSHVDYSVTEDTSILRAESYQALVNSILYFVGEHASGGTIRLYNYTGNVEADLNRAAAEVTLEDPMGAYAVSGIEHKATRILTYYEVELHITYRRTAGEVAALRTVSGRSGIREELGRMADQVLPSTTLRTAYFTGDAKAVSDLFWLAYYGDPAVAVSTPTLTVTFYPEDAPQRILEVEAQWPLSRRELERYARQLDDAGAALTADALPAGEFFTAGELAALLHATLVYDPSGEGSALAALQGEPANDLGLLLAMEQLCLQHSLEAMPVCDTSGAQMWLIVATPSGYRHLLPRDLRPAGEADPEAPSEPLPEWQLPLYTDEELAALGFEWPRDLHPACVDYSGAIPES